MIFNTWQRAVARTYDGGDYAYLCDQAEVTREELADCGDTLFVFLTIELSDQGDCEDDEEAIRRVARAREQLDAAISVPESL